MRQVVPASVLRQTYEGDGLVVIAVTSLASAGFVTEKMKLPPSGPIGSQEAHNASDGSARSEKQTADRKPDGILKPPPPPK